jgi:hypothetical protein
LPLAGLIIGGDDSSTAALLPVAGQSLIEYQVRIARASGAGHIVMLVDQIPAAMVAAFDRLRADGIDIDIARDARDAADRIHPDEQLLVFASGIVADKALVSLLAGQTVSTLMTLPDSAENANFERIDAADRWAGLALIDGKLLREIVAMLGDWTLASTLLRSALQAGAARLPVPQTAVLGKIGTEAEGINMSRKLATAASIAGDGLFSRYIAAPFAAQIVPNLLRQKVPIDLVAVLPLVFLGMSLLLIATGWPGTAFAIFLVAALPFSAGSVMANMAARSLRPLSLMSRARLPVFCSMLLLYGYSQFASGLGWGAIVTALWAGSALLSSPSPRRWYVDVETAALVMLSTTIIGQPLVGMGLIIAALVGGDAFRRWQTL